MPTMLVQYLKDEKWYFKINEVEFGPYDDEDLAAEDHERFLQRMTCPAGGSCE